MHKRAQLIALSVEYLPISLAVGIISCLLGLALLGGQAAVGHASAPFIGALLLAVILIIAGVIIIATPLLTWRALRAAQIQASQNKQAK